MRRLLTLFVLSAMSLLTLMAQNDLIVGQYIHNRFAINPSFAGNRDGLTIFGGWRKQWAGIENTPMSILLSGHAPLRNENLVAGAQIWNQHIHQSSNTGVEVAVGYRFRVTSKTWVSLALMPGVAVRSTDWTKIKTTDAGDDVFGEKTSAASPLMGFGASLYSKRYFAGVSVTSFFVSDDFENSEVTFSPGDAQYVLTGGFVTGENDVKIQPSIMASYSKANSANATISMTGIYKDFIWADVAYSTKHELSVGCAVQVKPQLRVAYNYGITTGSLNDYSNGCHEISVQYDFVYRVKTIGPRFF